MATQTKPKQSADAATETPARVLPLEITKVGNLTDDPALDFAKETNRPFARFRLAVERPKVPGDWAGERETTYYSVTCFDSVATNVCESLAKGRAPSSSVGPRSTSGPTRTGTSGRTVASWRTRLGQTCGGRPPLLPGSARLAPTRARRPMRTTKSRSEDAGLPAPGDAPWHKAGVARRR